MFYWSKVRRHAGVLSLFLRDHVTPVSKHAGGFLGLSDRKCNFLSIIKSHQPGRAFIQSRMLSADVPRNYDSAISQLMCLPSISSVIKTSEKEKESRQYNVRNTNVDVTRRYLSRLGISAKDLDSLNIVHVAGTKGKGSTCALTESILRQCGYSTGFMSSPHLMEVRERVRLNGMVMSRDLFAKYFYEMWDMFASYETTENDTLPRFPSFLKYIVVMSYYVFIKEQINVAIIEVGLGGRYDCTNIAEKPLVTAITHLGYDHCSILGHTIEEIAWEKAGIIKTNTPLLTVSQHYAASMPVLLHEARSKHADLSTVPPLSHYPNPPILANPSPTWDDNISLALQIAKMWISRYKQNRGSNQNGIMETGVAPFKIPDSFLKGVTSCEWPGRNHIIYQNNISYYLDGAHTPLSIKLCSKWFKDASTASKKVVIVNATRDRHLHEFVEMIRHEVPHIHLLVFCPNIASNKFIVKDCEWPDDIKHNLITRVRDYQVTWQQQDPAIPSLAFTCVEESLNHIRQVYRDSQVDVLITGSLHLIGAALQILDPGFLEQGVGCRSVSRFTS